MSSEVRAVCRQSARLRIRAEGVGQPTVLSATFMAGEDGRATAPLCRFAGEAGQPIRGRRAGWSGSFGIVISVMESHEILSVGPRKWIASFLETKIATGLRIYSCAWGWLCICRSYNRNHDGVRGEPATRGSYGCFRAGGLSQHRMKGS